MSRSVIECRDCQHTLAHRHHSGRIDFDVGIRAVLLPDGRVQAVCPCGNKQVIHTQRAEKAA